MFTFNSRILTVLTFLIILTSTTILLPQSPEPDEYYVKVTGSNQNNGDYDHPFQTVTFA